MPPPFGCAVPNIEKSQRREKKRQKRDKMTVDGRGLITTPPNFERRREKERSQRKRRNRNKRT